LRVLQEKEIMRVGGNSIIPVDVRVIAATNKDLQSLVDKGQFRKDLYYRLKVLYFTVPPLRERPEDIYFLVNYFLNNKNDSKVISDRVYKIFKDHNWPGNVRELENIINYISSVVEENKVEPRHLPEEFQKIDKDKKEENNNENNRINKKLKEEGNLKEFIGILNVLYEAQNQGINIGRKRIADKLKERQLRLTPEMVRGRLKVLEKYKLIEIGKTRQGSSLTKQGKELIKLN